MPIWGMRSPQYFGDINRKPPERLAKWPQRYILRIAPPAAWGRKHPLRIQTIRLASAAVLKSLLLDRSSFSVQTVIVLFLPPPALVSRMHSRSELGPARKSSKSAAGSSAEEASLFSASRLETTVAVPGIWTLRRRTEQSTCAKDAAPGAGCRKTRGATACAGPLR